MTRAIAIRTAGDIALSGALAEGMVAMENRRLRAQLAEADLIIDHLMGRIERHNAQRLRQYYKRPKRSLLKRFWGKLVVKETRAGQA